MHYLNVNFITKQCVNNKQSNVKNTIISHHMWYRKPLIHKVLGGVSFLLGYRDISPCIELEEDDVTIFYNVVSALLPVLPGTLQHEKEGQKNK